MKLPWGQSGTKERRRGVGVEASDPDAQSCRSLHKVLNKILKQQKARILDLGPFCGDSAVYLAGRGARVSVEAFEPPPPTPPPDPDAPRDAPAPQGPPLSFGQGDRTFDLVLAWEQLDFVPPDRLSDFGAELHRVLDGGGYALLFARNSHAGGEKTWRRPGRYRVLADDKVKREDAGGEDRQRWVHPTREIERALAPLIIDGIQLQRNQTREFLAHRRSD
jgi:hypothetical protein